MVPKFKKVREQSETQTLKANATPRIGQGTGGKKRSAYHEATMPRTQYGGVSDSYNVGRTHRVGHKI